MYITVGFAQQVFQVILLLK